MADKGTSCQTLRHKLNQRSEKAVNEYLSSSKAVQTNNAILLSGSEERNETSEEISKATVQCLNDKNETFEETKQDSNEKSSGSEPDLMTKANDAISLFTHFGGVTFSNCQIKFEVSK